MRWGEGGARAAGRRRVRVGTPWPTKASALRRFERQGYDKTTVAEIADDADLSVRSFFRYFADKEEVLFPDDGPLLTVPERALAEGAEQFVDSPVALVTAGLRAVACSIEERRPRLAARPRVIAAHPALRGRQQLKLAQWQDRAREQLVELGLDRHAASLSSGAGLTIWREAYQRWLVEPRPTGLSELVDRVRDELGALFDRAAPPWFRAGRPAAVAPWSTAALIPTLGPARLSARATPGRAYCP
jgi:AcrR family transcriptional regulator